MKNAKKNNPYNNKRVVWTIFDFIKRTPKGVSSRAEPTIGEAAAAFTLGNMQLKKCIV